MKKTVSIVLACILFASLLGACGSGGSGGYNPPSMSGNKVYRIGGTGPLTGGAAIYGNSVKQGAELAVSEINALGGIQFELNFQDDEHDAEKAVNAYNALKDWKMQIFLSAVTSTPASNTAPLAYADRFFGITPSASSTSVTEGNDNIYQMCFSDPNQGSASAQYISNNKLGTNVAVIYKNDDVYSSGIYETFVSMAGQLGLNIVSATTFTDDSQTDFSVQISDAKSKNADVIFLPIYYQPASLIFAQANAIGYSPIFYGVDGMDGILTLEGFDTSLAEGVMMLTPLSVDSADPKTAHFVSQYRAKYKETPTQFAAGAYDCIYAIYEAIRDSGGRITPEMNHQKICEEFIRIFNGNFTFNGVTGTNMSWNSAGQVSKYPKAIIIQNGEYVGLE